MFAGIKFTGLKITIHDDESNSSQVSDPLKTGLRVVTLSFKR